ncbi:MAG: hypothetical protein HGGPFJEG_02975 [Ignavibacteria bacterium]|nr:hypothetical protein [Ignavibacteria bacterium]
MTNEKKQFRLKVYDNFHYMDESETYEYGDFETYNEALIAAKAIVDDFLEHNWKSGVTPSYLLGQFSMFGEDPIIVSNKQEEHGWFSARNYATSERWKFVRNLKINI